MSETSTESPLNAAAYSTYYALDLPRIQVHFQYSPPHTEGKGFLHFYLRV